MLISVGDVVPDATFAVPTNAEPVPRCRRDIFANRTVVMIGDPGAFTPTCSMNHLPSFIENPAAVKAKGVDELLLTSVNDPFVMAAWEKQVGEGKATFLAGGSAAFTRATGAELDLTALGPGIRSQRHSMIVEDGGVTIACRLSNPAKAGDTKAGV